MNTYHKRRSFYVYRNRTSKYTNSVAVNFPSCRWVDSIKIDLREIGWDVMDWIDLVQDRDQWRALVNTVMNAVRFSSSCTTGSFSRRAQLHK
jgi:hypothetical protein